MCKTGSIDVSPNIPLAASVPGLTGAIQRLNGQAGGALTATLNVQLSDDTLRQPGRTAGDVEQRTGGVACERRLDEGWADAAEDADWLERFYDAVECGAAGFESS